MAHSVILMQTKNSQTHDEIELETIEAQFKKELKEAEDWFANGILADENKWVQSGGEVDALFDAKYRDEPATSPSPKKPVLGGILTILRPIAIPLVALIAIVIIWRMSRKTTPPSQV